MPLDGACLLFMACVSGVFYAAGWGMSLTCVSASHLVTEPAPSIPTTDADTSEKEGERQPVGDTGRERQTPEKVQQGERGRERQRPRERETEDVKTTPKQPGRLFFKGVPLHYTETDVRNMIRTFIERETPTSEVEERASRILGGISNLVVQGMVFDRKGKATNRRVRNGRVVMRWQKGGEIERGDSAQEARVSEGCHRAGDIYFRDREVAQEALLVMRYQRIGDAPDAPELHVMWCDAHKTADTKGNVFVSQLDPNVSARQICQAFEGHGGVVSVRVLRRYSGILWGAYVQFEKAEEAARVIETVNGTVVLGTEVKVEAYVPTQQRVGGNKKECDNVFIDNLPPGFTSEALRVLLEKHVGPTLSVYAGVDTRKHIGRVFGSARFASHEDAARALDIVPEIPLEDGQTLVCCPHRAAAQRQRMSHDEGKEREALFYDSGRGVFVVGIGFGPTKAPVVRLMTEALQGCGPITMAALFPKRKQRPRMGIVVFESPESATKAIETLNCTLIPSLNMSAPVQVCKAQRSWFDNPNAITKTVRNCTVTLNGGNGC
ncbi:hypothetical protein KIPB_005355 [Kipferlia bialata]|uniref:RRM domain-containing protein n=1 Tax=Kipferlia bialata TaxID=797122 RepID=A0A9K3CX22_9EUKA|nr:hypothetical protein KIPB_005355 [Kipferlia bialata]|eukprot:g5355.t1